LAKRTLLAQILAGIVAAWIGSATAAGPVRPLTTTCIERAAERYGVHIDVLLAILMVEGGTVGQNSRANSNGSYDIGPFQINSMHRKELQNIGVDEDTLRNNGCVNAMVAARHLMRTVTPQMLAGIRTQEDYLRVIANYHSATPKYNQIYADKLLKAFNKLYASDQQ
jgi:hypothetical protein